jgi:hypothetical protein
MFLIRSYERNRNTVMSTPTDRLKPAAISEVAEALSRALLYDGRRRVHDADLVIGRVTAAMLVEHLGGAGFVIMKRAGATAPSTSAMPGSRIPPET